LSIASPSILVLQHEECDAANDKNANPLSDKHASVDGPHQWRTFKCGRTEEKAIAQVENYPVRASKIKGWKQKHHGNNHDNNDKRDLLFIVHHISDRAPNARIKPTCVVEAKAWQAFSATLLLERNKFGLNELLGRSPGAFEPRVCVPTNADTSNERAHPENTAQPTKIA
jgi:hypothetical protein